MRSRIPTPPLCAFSQAEEVRAHSRFAKGLRALAPKSKWWTEMPHDVDML